MARGANTSRCIASANGLPVFLSMISARRFDAECSSRTYPGAGIESQRIVRDVSHQTRGRLMRLQDRVVVAARVDVGEPRSLLEQIPYRDAITAAHVGTMSATRVSSVNARMSTRRMIAAAVNCVDTDAMWSCVSRVIGTRPSRSAQPRCCS